MLDDIIAALKQGERVNISGFGTFSVSERQARTGRNPKTGESIQISASRSAKFKPGKQLKDSLNDAVPAAARRRVRRQPEGRRAAGPRSDRRRAHTGAAFDCHGAGAVWESIEVARAVSSVVEHRPYKPRVAGSKPAPPTNHETRSPRGQSIIEHLLSERPEHASIAPCVPGVSIAHPSLDKVSHVRQGSSP